MEAERRGFPSYNESLSIGSSQLPSFLSSLSLPSSYSTSSASTLSLIKSSLSSFALSPLSPHSLLFYSPSPPPSITDSFLLSTSSTPHSQPSSSSHCNTVFKSGESVYRCRECALDPTCVLCTKCYLGSIHSTEKHDVTLSIHSGTGAGCCDCGDEEAFKEGKPNGCKYHRRDTDYGDGMDDLSMESLKLVVEERVRIVVDWMIATLEQSPTTLSPPRSVDDIISTLPQPVVQPTLSRPSRSTSFTSFLPSYTSSTSRGKARASSPPPPKESSTPAGPWSVVLWNDEKHSFAQVIDQVSRATLVSRPTASSIANLIDTHGRAVIFISSDPVKLLKVSKLIAEIDLVVTVRTSQETFEEDVCGEVVGWLNDISAWNEGVLREGVVKVMLERGEGGSRFQKLIGVEGKLWKRARKELIELWVGLIGVSSEVRRELGIQYAQSYPSLCETYLLSDPAPESSVISLSVQLFTVPSLALHLLQSHHLLPTILGLLYAFFTEQLSPSQPFRLLLPPNPLITLIDPDSSAFRQKRYFQLFSDLSHLISNEGAQRLLCESLASLDALIAFLDLFTNMNSSKRAIENHIEFESDSWVQAFNLTIQLSKLTSQVGLSYSLSTPLQLAQALSHLILKLPGTRAAIHQVQFGGRGYQTIEFRVDREEVSFHHPVAWLWSCLCRNLEGLDEGNMRRELGVKGLGELVGKRVGGVHWLAGMDGPLRVIVLVSQIRSGLWVRNGFGMRAQQLHYKEYALRENTYDQDIFFLQTSLVILDPSLVLVAILDRFLLLDWLQNREDYKHPVYEPTQSFAMSEEMLYLIITLVSDPTYTSGLSSEQQLRREIVHHLCLAPLPYSELLRRLSERFSDDPSLELILEQVAKFKHPVGVTDQGTYSLKEDCFDEVNPYFSRYSRNQREEADKILREKRKKLGLGEVIVPKRLEITRGPFVSLTKTLGCEVLHRIVFLALQHGRARGSHFSEVLVDEALQLLILALVEESEGIGNFADNVVMSEKEDEKNLVKLLVKIEDDVTFKGLKHKLGWSLDRLDELIGGEKVSGLRKVVDENDGVKPEKAALDARRLAAKARQAAIMEQFSRAQHAFLESSENVIDDDEDDDGDDPMGVGGTKVSLGSCIVCQDELDSSQPFGSLAFVQTSNFIRLTPMGGENLDFQSEVLATPSSLDHDASSIRPFGIASKKIAVNTDDESGDGISRGFPQETQSGLHASACGHMMHLACFETYYQSLEQRHHVQQTRCHPESTERKEFICPLCKSLGNALLPASVETFELPLEKIDGSDLAQWATIVVDPRHHAAVRGVALEEIDDFFSQMRQLQRRGGGPQTVTGLGAWELGVKTGSRLSLRQPEAFKAGENLMIGRLLAVTSALGKEMGSNGGLLPNDLMAYTISAIEVASRGHNESASIIPEATTRMLQSLLQTLRVLVQIQTGETPYSNTLAAIAIAPHMGGIFATDKRSPDFYKINPLATLIETAAIVPESFHQVAAFCFYSELVKTFFRVVQFLEANDEVIPYQGDAGDSAFADYIALAAIRSHLLAPSNEGMNSPDAELTIGKYIYSAMLPFLRRASILQSVIFGPTTPLSTSSTESELSRLLTSLRIPHPSLILRPTAEGQPLAPGASALRAHLAACVQSVPGWTQYIGTPAPFTLDSVTGLPYAIPDHILAGAGPLQHPAIYELVGLSSQLSTLAAEGIKRECENCGRVPEEPAICLLCGQLVCNQSFCCMDGEEEAQHGECNMHMWTCGGSVGIYFLVKRNIILYLYADKGTFASPPYLDSHGEVDMGSRRGRNMFPQYLHAGRYDEIRKTWLNHGIPTYVARKLEATIDHGGWPTM